MTPTAPVATSATAHDLALAEDILIAHAAVWNATSKDEVTRHQTEAAAQIAEVTGPLRADNARMAALLNRIEREDAHFAARCDQNLAAIADLMAGEKRLDETLAEAVGRVLAERDAARQQHEACKSVLKEWQDAERTQRERAEKTETAVQTLRTALMDTSIFWQAVAAYYGVDHPLRDAETRAIAVRDAALEATQ